MINYESPEIGTELTCPVCKKQFAYDPKKHLYITKGGFVCDWNCFLSDVYKKVADTVLEEIPDIPPEPIKEEPKAPSKEPTIVNNKTQVDTLPKTNAKKKLPPVNQLQVEDLW